MRKKRLLWHIYPPFLLVVLLALFAVTWYATGSLRRFHLERTAADLASSAHLIEKQVIELLEDGAKEEIDALCKDLGARSGRRVTVVLPSGEVIGDSEEDPARMDNHGSRPEIRQAMGGTQGTSTRHSHTVQKSMMYVAVPLKHGDRLVGVVRTSVAVSAIDRALGAIYTDIALVVVAVAAVAAIISLVISRRISRPLEELEQGAQRFADGELALRVAVSDTMEIGRVAEAMNRMAGQLGERLDTIARQRNEQEAVLSSMTEGVFAVDARQHLISINQVAASMLGIDPDDCRNAGIGGVARSTALQALVEAALEADEPVERDIASMGEGERFLHAHGAPLRDSHGDRIGAVFVLNDITRLRQLENVRRDFVANVSHELRTPITSIKGFVETLSEGAIETPEDARRFLGIIARQVDRLNAIIEDLLALSGMEQDPDGADIVLERHPLTGALEEALVTCSGKAMQNGVVLDVDCADDLHARMNPALIGQAVANLIDNAITHSEAGASVQVRATTSHGDVLLSIRDEGCGIEEEHLHRIFERFYRVDKARSRKLGGTGLGLAIVKHIAQVHGGSVTAESTPGKGSTFTLRLPAA